MEITYLKRITSVKKDELKIKDLRTIYDMIKTNPGIKIDTKELNNWLLDTDYKKGKNKNLDDEYKKLKSKLPAFIPSGEFHNATNDGLDIGSYNALIVIDIDDLDSNILEKYKSIIEKEKSIVLGFISPSKKGIKFIHRLDYRGLSTLEDIEIFHYSAFLSLQKHYQHTYGVEIDTSGKDLSRKCFICHDENAYWNDKPEKWSWGFNLEEEKRKLKKEEEIVNEGLWYKRPAEGALNTCAILDDIISWSSSNNGIIVNNYDDWVKCGFAILNETRDEKIAEDLFLQLSRTNDKFDSKEFYEKWENIKTSYNPSRRNVIGLGSIIWMAINNGYDAKKVRARSGTNFILWVLFVLEEKNIKIRNNFYKGFEILEKNNWRTFSDEDLISINVKNFDFKITDKTLNDIIIAYAPKWNPVTELKNKITSWDGKDYFKELLNTIEFTDDENKEAAQVYIKKWMIGVCQTLFTDSLHDSYNENVLIFIGSQYIGKSRWIRKLLPPELRNYFAEKNIDPKEKDDILLATQNIIVFMDELANIISNKMSNEDMKSFLSQPKFTLREAYGKKHKDYRRMASFVGTSNEDNILTDLTGNRRYWIVEVDKLDHNHKVDLIGLWSQMYSLWIEGEPHYLLPNEFEILNKRNTKYKAIDPTEEIINKYWSPTPLKKDQEPTYMIITDMKEYVKEQGVFENATHKKWSRILRHLNFEKNITTINNRPGRYQLVYEKNVPENEIKEIKMH